MNVWYHLSTIINLRFALRTAGLIAMCVALTTTLIFAHATQAAPGINATLNFQARLQTSGGAVVPDGHYNVQFKIYQDGAGTAAGNPGGTLKWTETYINNGGTSGVEVKNGYMSVSLGSNNPFASQIDWNQDTLWLSMNIAGSAASCTTFNSGSCVSDGEMTPMKRLTSTPYALNSGQLGGKTAQNFVQLSQGVQEDAANNTSSIHINKTGTDGNFLQLQNAGSDVLTVGNNGNLTFGATAGPQIISVATAAANEDGTALGIAAGDGGNGTGSDGGNLVLRGGNGGGLDGSGGDTYLDAGGKTGTGTGGSLYIGTTNASSIAIGNPQTQTISIGDSSAGSITNVVVGTGSSATSGSTTIQSKDDTTISTDGTQRARFSGDSNTLYLGNADASGQATTANSFAIQGTSSTGSNVQGGGLAVQAGSATNGNANGGDLTLGGGAGAGTGSEGLIVLSSPTAFQAASVQTCGSSCAITQANVDSNGVVIVNASAAGVTFTLNAPTNTTAGRIVYVMAANGSNDFTLSVNGGGAGNLTSMRQNTTATMVWSGGSGGFWTVAGASNSTTLQSAYDNTLQSAGGAELIVSSGSNANGLTIRDSSTNPVNGTLLEVQNASASTLFSVNSNVPEYVTNGGAETNGGSDSSFPSNTWGSHGSSTVTRHTPADQYVATGQASVKVETTNNTNAGASNMLSKALTPNMTYNVSFGTRLAIGSPFTDMYIGYSLDGSGTLTACKTNAVATISSWTKVSCSFKTPASGITSSNAIIVRQTSASVRTFYIDNLSVTIAGNQNYATDGNVNNIASFGTNWTTTNAPRSTVSHQPGDGYEKSDSAQAVTTAGGTYAGMQNKLSINPLRKTLYRISAYVKSDATFNDFTIRYTHNGSTYTDCVDYNTQSVTTSWSQITCFVETPDVDPTNTYVQFVDETSANLTFRVDMFEMNLATNTAANVQVGGGSNGGQTTLFTLDQGASAPISDNNDALLGSMYYDTTLGKIQCYESDGWGACGSSPDNIITISPEYTNAVMQGPSVGTAGVGTMTSGLCSNGLAINTSICGTNETYNYYKWTSPQTGNQTYAIYVTYQLPTTFKSFASGSTSIKGRTDNGSNGGSADLSYKVFKNNPTNGLTPCGGTVPISTGTVGSWQTGTASGTADPSTCGFAAGDSIVFEIDMTANRNANVYVSNLGFTFSNN